MVRARDREAEALRLRKAGKSYAVIAEELEVSETGARDAVKRGMIRITKLCDEDAEELRRLEVERLDALLAGLWEDAAKGNLQAVDRVLKVAERRAKLLGLDAADPLPVAVPADEAVTDVHYKHVPKTPPTEPAPENGGGNAS